MTFAQEYEFAFKALVVGCSAIAVNVLPFLMFLLKEIKASKENNSDGVDMISSIAKAYFLLLFVVLVWFFLVKTLNAVDESESFLPLLGDDGLFHYFWHKDLSSIISNGINNGEDVFIFYSIQWTRMWFGLIVTAVTFIIVIWGMSVGYSQGKKVSDGDDYIKMFGYTLGGLILSFFLLAIYTLVTQDSFFNGETIIDVISQTWYDLIVKVKK